MAENPGKALWEATSLFMSGGMAINMKIGLIKKKMDAINLEDLV
jgi:hypothetical protein